MIEECKHDFHPISGTFKRVTNGVTVIFYCEKCNKEDERYYPSFVLD